MRLETIPLILGILVALVGVGLVLDGWIPDEVFVRRERRRRPRQERHRRGEVLIGLGTLAMAAAFLGRDQWRYRILVTMAGTVLLLIGVWLNRAYVRQLLVNRGAARRGLPHKKAESGETRIR